MLKINLSSLSHLQIGLIIGVILALSFFLWITFSSIYNNYQPLEVTSCNQEEGCKTETFQMSSAEILYIVVDDLVAGLPTALFLIIVFTFLGFLIGKAKNIQTNSVGINKKNLLPAESLDNNTSKNRYEKKPVKNSVSIYKLSFAWAGFILGIISGVIILNYLNIHEGPWLLGIAIICSGLGFVLGVKFETKNPSKPSSVVGKGLDVLLLSIMILIGLLVLIFGLLANADWSVIFT